MTYRDVIEKNGTLYPENSWWTKAAFHYTDVQNAVGILKTGFLYSRIDAKKRNIMQNDNASKQVIDITSLSTTSLVRFYFRPKTPTQYHNEGFKHPDIRFENDENANVPVPIFFIFNLEKLLNKPGVSFSETSLAGGGGCLLTGVENFSKLNFKEIYKDGRMDNPAEEKKYRHAELVHQGPFPIDDSLEYIACRNEVERQTLLNLLRREDLDVFKKYGSKVIEKNKCFMNNGLYIERCLYYDGRVVAVLSSSAAKVDYLNRYNNSQGPLMVNCKAEFAYKNPERVVMGYVCEFSVNYKKQEQIDFAKMVQPEEANSLYMKIFFEDKLMCFVCWQLAGAALW